MSRKRLIYFALAIISISFPSRIFGQLSTEDHLDEPRFWPRQGVSPAVAYVGTKTCAKCHSGITASQQTSRMAQAAMPATKAQFLHSHPNLSFRSDQYLYRIKTDSTRGTDESRFSILDEKDNRTFPLLWAFGAGRVAQSYLFKKDGDGFYEARVTYYQSLGGLGFTPARALSAPSDIDEAMYRPVPAPEITRCFSCHTTGSTVGGGFDEKHLAPGIQCEACHGPGLAHADAMKGSGNGMKSREDSHIYNPTHLVPTDSIEFCGACHGSWWDVKLSNVKGVSTTRSAPYRLASSKCWGKGQDSRLKCTGCHDPHKPLETRAETYDAVCLQCHLASINAKGSQDVAGRPAVSDAGRIRAACPVGTAKCTSCHMPKTYVPDMHDSFTDHRIRVVRAGESFPE